MYRIQEAIARFMSGRYGSDQLNIFLLCLGVALNIILGLVGLESWAVISFIPLAWAVFRLFSRRHEKRRHENIILLNAWSKLSGFFRRILRRAKDSRVYKHCKCPSCSAPIRVPRGKGTIKITCPKCQTVFIKKT